MVLSDSILVSLVKIIDQLPQPPTPASRKRGCPPTYSDQLMLKALVIMIVRRLYSAWALLRGVACGVGRSGQVGSMS